MADLQTQFLEFHDRIKLDDDNENAQLREKRETIVAAIRAGLARRAEDTDGRRLTFTQFNQGSYAIGTGIMPADGNYDIDVGIVLPNRSGDFQSPLELKTIVRDAIDTHNRTLRIRRPCVTVTYMRNDAALYHVDLAIYVETTSNRLQLAVGKERSDPNDQCWQEDDPKGLIDTIKTRNPGEDGAQFRRMIRFLKKWRDTRLPTDGSPPSIALTCSAYHWYTPNRFLGAHVDLQALKNLVDAMLQHFQGARLVVTLPAFPFDDVMARLTADEMAIFRARLQELQAALQEAIASQSISTACIELQRQFGDDFPLPTNDDAPSGGPTGTPRKSQTRPYVTTGTSA